MRPVDLGVVAPLNVGGAEAAQQEKPGFASRTAEGGCPHPGAVCDTVHYFASVAGVGLDAEVSRQANELPRWLRGHGGYAIALAGSLFRFAPLPMKVIARAGDGWSMRSDQPTMLAAFANTSTYGGGMKIAPHARVDDGQLDVCVIGGIDPFRLACMFPTVYFGRHLRIREVQYFQAERVRVETESPRDVYADGEFVCQTPFEVGIQRKVLPVIVGAEVDITGRSR